MVRFPHRAELRDELLHNEQLSLGIFLSSYKMYYILRRYFLKNLMTNERNVTNVLILARVKLEPVI